MSKQRLQRLAADKLTAELFDRGRLIEAGFAAFCMHMKIYPANSDSEYLFQLQTAFYAGAEHVWSSTMNVLDADEEPTARDMERMGKLQDEIDRIRERLELTGALPKGSA